MKLEKGQDYFVEAIKDTLSYHKGFKCWISLVDYNYNRDINGEPKIRERVWVRTMQKIKYDYEFIFYIEPNEVDKYFKIAD